MREERRRGGWGVGGERGRGKPWVKMTVLLSLPAGWYSPFFGEFGNQLDIVQVE